MGEGGRSDGGVMGEGGRSDGGATGIRTPRTLQTCCVIEEAIPLLHTFSHVYSCDVSNT